MQTPGQQFLQVNEAKHWCVSFSDIKHSCDCHMNLLSKPSKMQLSSWLISSTTQYLIVEIMYSHFPLQASHYRQAFITSWGRLVTVCFLCNKLTSPDVTLKHYLCTQLHKLDKCTQPFLTERHKTTVLLGGVSLQCKSLITTIHMDGHFKWLDHTKHTHAHQVWKQGVNVPSLISISPETANI